MLGGIKISQICEEPPSIHVVCRLRGGFINAVLTKDSAILMHLTTQAPFTVVSYTWQ